MVDYEGWKREYAEIEREVSAIRAKLADLKGILRFQSIRIDLRRLLNERKVRQHALKQRINKYETELDLHNIFKDISGLSDKQIAKLYDDLERLRKAPLSPLIG